MEFRKVYEEYIATVSSEAMALSWESLAAIGETLEELRLRRILEYGSGISTCLLADHARSNGADVESFDSDPQWADRTRAFLRERDLDGWACVSQCNGVEPAEAAELVLWDFDRNPTRVALMAAAFSNVASGGVMYVDDMQNGEISAACATVGGEVIRTTAKDPFGRFGVFVQRLK